MIERRRVSRPARRRGIAVILVLGIMAVTLALSYALVRSQTQTKLVQDNFTRQTDARLAAETGMARAMQEMTTSSWTGIATPLTGSLNSRTSYTVTYAVGDSSLTSASSNWSEYPFRVTITSVGRSTDRDNASLITSYTVRSVMQLVRKQVASQPTAWTSPQNYLVYQYNVGRGPTIQTPFRMEGNVLLRGMLNFAADYPRGSSPRSRYFGDLYAMRNTSYGDHRPLTGSMTTMSYFMNSETVQLFQGMGTTFVDSFSFATSPPVNHPGNLTTYRLYPGGPTYSIPDLYANYGTTLTNVTLQPEMTSNPLGIYRTSGSITLGANTKLTGTLLATNSDVVRIGGSGVQITGYNLPAINGSTTTRQLPAMLVNGAIACNSGSASAIKGLVMCYDRFEVSPQTDRTTMALEGRMILNDLDVEGMSDWTKTDSWWGTRRNEFMTQLSGTNPTPYFPVWLKNNFGVEYASTLTVKPSSSPVTYHWHSSWDQPIYQASSADGGLRWNIVSWQEGL